MPHQIRSANVVALLAEIFPLAEGDFHEDTAVTIPAKIVGATDRLFLSSTQAYRQAAVGCAVARILDQQVDIQFPATEEGPDSEHSYSGRSVDEGAVMPFLREKAVPILDASAYLGPLRGGARLVPGGEPRIQRDKKGFAALVTIVAYLRNLAVDDAKAYLRFLLRRFVQLRETGNIALKQIAKPNLTQLDALIGGVLGVRSGGRFPAMLATAMFQTLGECHKLGWEVEFQGINVADKASGAVGDITIRKDGEIILGVEVTERPIPAARVTETFEQKVSPAGLRDYLFITTAPPQDEALSVARSYTAVGHEINFVLLRGWAVHLLSTIGPDCRLLFQTKMIALLAGQGADLKVAWNDQMDLAIRVKSKGGSK